MNKEELKLIEGEIKSISLETIEETEKFKNAFLGKKGKVPSLLTMMQELSGEEKKEFGKLINDLKKLAEDKYLERKTTIENAFLKQKEESEAIDVTLPGTKMLKGGENPLNKIINEIEELFVSMGYDVVEGPEVEQDLYNFEMLNLPKGHPARDAQDTFYITDEMLLRSQTSPVQVRTMLANKEKTPIRIICPGKVYRRDNDDPTHSHQFFQIEGLLVDEKISLAELKGTLDIFAKKIFGEERKTRFRPSYYSFTEPSVEFDASCSKCGGNGCEICKGTGWVTIMGAGIVHPNVLKMAGYDPDKYTGFAFGIGAERIAMLKYGINDIRYFYQNNLKTSKQFNRMGGVNNDEN